MMARDTNQFVLAVDYILDLMTAGHQQSVITAYKNSKLNENLKMDETIGEDDPLNVVALSTKASNQSKDIMHSPTSSIMTTSTNTTFISKPHFEIIDVGGGTAVKIVSNEACALMTALTELIKVCFSLLNKIFRVVNRKMLCFKEFH